MNARYPIKFLKEVLLASENGRQSNVEKVKV